LESEPPVRVVTVIISSESGWRSKSAATNLGAAG
jgi:hypothetical protein